MKRIYRLLGLTLALNKLDAWRHGDVTGTRSPLLKNSFCCRILRPGVVQSEAFPSEFFFLSWWEKFTHARLTKRRRRRSRCRSKRHRLRQFASNNGANLSEITCLLLSTENVATCCCLLCDYWPSLISFCHRISLSLSFYLSLSLTLYIFLSLFVFVSILSLYLILPLCISFYLYVCIYLYLCISFYLYVCLPISLYLPLSLHLCLSLCLCLSLYICLSVCTPPCSYSLSSLASVQISYSVSLSVFLFASNSFSLSLTNILFLYLYGFVCVNLLVAVQKSKRLLQISTLPLI